MASTTYYWDEVSDHLLCEEDEYGVITAEYENEPSTYGELVSQKRDDQRSYYHFDGQGSTRALTDESESVTDTATYTTFGESVEKTGTTENSFGYGAALGYLSFPTLGSILIGNHSYSPRLGLLENEDTTPPFRFDPIADKICRKMLLGAIAGGGTYYDYPCASSLLRHFLLKTTPEDSCPAACRDQLSSFLDHVQPPISGCAGRYAASTGGGCNQGEVFRFHLAGSATFEKGSVDRDVDEDLFFAFGSFNWESRGVCLGSCGPKSSCGCCNCTARCIHDISVSEPYDFCSSCGRTDPRYTLCWCGCYLEDTGLGKTFPIKCDVKYRTEEKWKQCGEQERNVESPPEFNCMPPAADSK